VAERLLAERPGHLEEAWLINGHTLLLQAAFYGHLAWRNMRWSAAQTRPRRPCAD